MWFLIVLRQLYRGDKMSTENKKKLSLYTLTWPIFIEILLHMLMGNADTLLLSQYSDDSVAAVGVANQIMSIVIVMFGFVAAGAAIVISQYLGAEQDKKASEVTRVALGLNLLFSVFISLILFLFTEPLLYAMNLPDGLMEFASPYLMIVGFFSFIQGMIMTIGAVLRCHSYTKDVMYTTIGMNVLNIIGNFLFIFGPFGIPVLGVTGVAISTVISRTIGLIVLYYIFLKRTRQTIIFKSLFTFTRKYVNELLRIGIPSAGEHLSYNSSQIMITYFIAMLGTEALTTKVYTQNIVMFVLIFSLAIGQGNQIIVGRLTGAKSFDDAYTSCLRHCKIALFISISMAIIFAIFSKNLFSIFTENQEIIQLGSTIILINILLEPGRTLNLVLANSLRAAGDVKFPVYIGILLMWGFCVPLGYLLAITFNLGLIGIWIALTADEWLRGLIMLKRWRSKKWQNMSFVVEGETAQT